MEPIIPRKYEESWIVDITKKITEIADDSWNVEEWNEQLDKDLFKYSKISTIEDVVNVATENGFLPAVIDVVKKFAESSHQRIAELAVLSLVNACNFKKVREIISNDSGHLEVVLSLQTNEFGVMQSQYVKFLTKFSDDLSDDASNWLKAKILNDSLIKTVCELALHTDSKEIMIYVGQLLLGCLNNKETYDMVANKEILDYGLQIYQNYLHKLIRTPFEIIKAEIEDEKENAANENGETQEPDEEHEHEFEECGECEEEKEPTPEEVEEEEEKDRMRTEREELIDDSVIYWNKVMKFICADNNGKQLIVDRPDIYSKIVQDTIEDFMSMEVFITAIQIEEILVTIKFNKPCFERILKLLSSLSWCQVKDDAEKQKLLDDIGISLNKVAIHPETASDDFVILLRLAIKSFCVKVKEVVEEEELKKILDEFPESYGEEYWSLIN